MKTNWTNGWDELAFFVGGGILSALLGFYAFMLIVIVLMLVVLCVELTG